MDSIKPCMYDRWLGLTGTYAFPREEVYKEFIAEAWCMIMSKIPDDGKTCNPISAGEFVMVLKQTGILVSEKVSPYRIDDEFDVSLRNWSYEIRQGLKGITIYPSCEYYPIDIGQWIITGTTPAIEQPYYFLAKILSAFDSSVPEILKTAREEEYRAMQALKRHQIRVSTIKTILNELEGEYVEIRYKCTGEDTRCTVIADGNVSIVTVFSDDDLAERIQKLRQEVHDILLNPFARIWRYAPRYSLLIEE